MFRALLSPILLIALFLQQPTASPSIPLEPGQQNQMAIHIDKSVTPPVLIHSVDPKFSDAARAEHKSGNVKLYLWVTTEGLPSHLRVVQGVGYGLDEEAIKAVRQYRFKPATRNGEPVTVDLYIDVNFQFRDH